MNSRRSAFTLLETCIIIAMVLVITALVIPALSKHREHSRRVKDAAQIRSIHQAMITWAGQGQDNYPLVGRIDLNDTLPGTDTKGPDAAANREFKNLPRFSMSLLVYFGSLTPEVFVSPSEGNPLIRPDANYEFRNPSAVAPNMRNQAICDPAFACYPDELGGDIPIARSTGVAPTAGCSYAFVPFIGGRRFIWQSTFDANQVVLGNRGPWYKFESDGTWSLDPSDKRGTFNTPATLSNSLTIHGPRNSWEGNVARNDNSVTFETRPDPASLTLVYEQGNDGSISPTPDNIFANEDEQGSGKSYSREDDRVTPANYDKRRNNYLRCWGGDGKGANLTLDREKGLANSIVNFWYD